MLGKEADSKGKSGSGIIRSGSPSFFASPLCRNLEELRSHIAFLGVPFDGATNDRPGSRFAPLAIREASMRLAGIEDRGWYDVELGRHILKGVRMADCGDVDIRTVPLAENFRKITEAVAMMWRTGAFPVIVGGDHAITYPIVKAFEGSFQKEGQGPLTVAQFDAHLDFTDEWKGQRYSHDNQMRRVIELPFVKGLIQVGIRSLQERDEPHRAAQEHGVIAIPALEVVRLGAADALSPVATLGGPCYVTIDIDVLDPAVAPGTGFPEPGGLSYYQLKEALMEVARKAQVVGFDLTEVSPPYDNLSGQTSRVAARLILDFLGAIFAARE